MNEHWFLYSWLYDSKADVDLFRMHVFHFLSNMSQLMCSDSFFPHIDKPSLLIIYDSKIIIYLTKIMKIISVISLCHYGGKQIHPEKRKMKKSSSPNFSRTTCKIYFEDGNLLPIMLGCSWMCRGWNLCFRTILPMLWLFMHVCSFIFALICIKIFYQATYYIKTRSFFVTGFCLIGSPKNTSGLSKF